MRSALFGRGYPERVPSADPIANPDDGLQILDLRDLSDETQSFTRFVTLFAWPIGGPGNDAEIYIQVGDQTPYFVGKISGSSEVTATDPSSMELQIRGDVRVIAAASAENTCAIFGYLELEDAIPSTEGIRPLQPSSPVFPFTVAPLLLNASESATLHTFEEGFIDTVSIDYSVSQTVVDTGVVSFTFPNGVSLVTKEIDVNNGQVNMMDGIPMLTSSSGQAITVTADADISRVTVSGTFIRI